VRLVLARAKQRRHIRDDPADGLRLVQAMGKKKGKRSRDDVRALEEDELTALLAALGKLPPTHQLLAEFLLQTGARIGEALALT
jgi:integrase